jgi:alkanesulfonate monooxygenase SsuD/methylene tetrahydromethanopterin reductase-like flavin-dependent oxidoreductase (luciferase family)
VEHSHRPSRLEEGVALIRQAWEQGSTGFDGKRFTVPDGPFEPRPAPGAPIYLGGVAPAAVDRAVRIGDGLMVYVTEYDGLPARYETYLEALAAHQRERAHFPFFWTTAVYLAESSDQAWAEAGPALAYLETPLRDVPLTADELPRERLLVGTPAEVAARLTDLYSVVPFDHLAFWSRLPGLTVDQARRSQQLFMDEVAPRLAT